MQSWRETPKIYSSNFHRFIFIASQSCINKTQLMINIKYSEIYTFLTTRKRNLAFPLRDFFGETGNLCVAPRGSLIAYGRFEELCRLHLQAYESIHVLKTLKMKTIRCSVTSGSNYPTKWRNKPETCFFNKRTNLKIIKSFTAVSVPVRQAATYPLDYLYPSL
jgi:hypothetical protein